MRRHRKGKADLIKIIEDLTTEMTTRFTDAFNEINENFKETFTALFGGGRAKLEIVENPNGNPLESGIEIYAQPPGKRMLNISSYSGGEQTLIAIAILFAIIKMRPMPFCVLDEIDTALDDANAGLLAKYLKHFRNARNSSSFRTENRRWKSRTTFSAYPWKSAAYRRFVGQLVRSVEVRNEGELIIWDFQQT